MRKFFCFVCLSLLCIVCRAQDMQSASLNEEEQTTTPFSTTLPIIYIDTKGESIGRDERTPATVRIESVSGQLPNDSTTFTHQIGIKVRGATAASFPKKSYSIEFCDSMGEEVNVSLFGLRSDDDWILDAMYIDHSRMRNRLCTDIWNAYNRIPHREQEPKALNGTRGLFVEVFLNGQYNGLYCLTERIDRKQLKLKKYKETCRGVSYKTVTWNNLMGWCAYDPEASKETLLWNGFEAEYPDVVEEVCWDYLQEFLEFISPDYTSDEQFASEVETFVHIENVIDYTLLVNAVYAIDNIAKNVYLNIYNVEEDRRMFFTPWDLDATFGRTYEGSVINKFAFEGAVPLGNVLIARLWEGDVCNFRARMKDRWQELKETTLSVDSVAERMYTYQNIFEESGAFSRELQLWPEKCSDISEEVDFMIDWYTHNVAVMDSVLIGEATNIENIFSPTFYIEGATLVVEGLNTTVRLYDMNGRMIEYSSSSYQHHIELPYKGVFIIHVEDTSQTKVYKIQRSK